MKLYPYQEEAVDWMVSRRGALLAFEQGLGKTVTSIVAADAVKAEHVLVLCQAVDKTHWAQEFSRFQKTPRAVTVIHGAVQPVPKQGVVIVNYDHISRLQDPLIQKLMKHDWDVVICDEAHALKSRKANRTKAVYGKRCDGVGCLAEKAKRVWLLTGTPMPGNASELWSHLRALAPGAITEGSLVMDEHQFVERYCVWRDTMFGRQITGSKNLAALKERIGDFMLRRRKKDVLPELPPLTFDTLPVHPTDAPHVPKSVLTELKHHEAALLDHPGFEGALAEEQDDLMATLVRLAADTHVATQRRLTGVIKAHIAVDLVKNELSGNDKKIIVFAHHTAVIDILMEGMADAGLGVVKIDGRDNHEDRAAAVQDFQNDPAVRVFVGQLDAAGTSITLTAASDVLFVEASWVPATNAQAAARAHRIGQKDGVLARFLTLEGSLDKQIMSTLARKARDISAVIDGEFQTPAIFPKVEA